MALWMVIKIWNLTSPVPSAWDKVGLDDKCMVTFWSFLAQNKDVNFWLNITEFN